MIVDDHASIRASLASLLRGAGFRVSEADTGEEAIITAAELAPQAALVDVDLGPGIDGFEVARRLHDLPHPPTVVITSSRDATAYTEQLRDAPVAGFVQKQEFTVQALRALLGDTA